MRLARASGCGRPKPAAQPPGFAFASARAPAPINSSLRMSARPSHEYVEVKPMETNEYSCLTHAPMAVEAAEGGSSATLKFAVTHNNSPDRVASFMGLRLRVRRGPAS